MNRIMIQSLSRQMDQKAKWQNMNLDLEENRDVKQELYETSNKGTILELRRLWIKEWPTRHQVYLIKVGTRKKVRTKGLYIRKNSLIIPS
jgi:hypothetical protein